MQIETVKLTAYYMGHTHWQVGKLEDDLLLFKSTDNKRYAIPASLFPRFIEIFRSGDKFIIQGEIHSEMEWRGKKFLILKNERVFADTGRRGRK